MFDFENSLKYQDFFTYYKNSSNEILYLLINFIVSRFTNNINFLFGVLQLIITLLIYAISKSQKEKAPVALTYLLLLLLFYNKTLNMVRQSIAILIILFSFKYLENNKKYKYILGVFIAILFHKTAIIGYVIQFLFYVCRSKNKYIYTLFIFLTMSIIILNYSNIINFLVNNEIISQRYLFYLSSDKINVSTIICIIKSFMILIIVMLNKGLIKRKQENYFFIVIMFFDLILYIMGNFINYFERFSFYFGIFNIINYIQIPYVAINDKDKKIMKVLVILCFCIYSYLIYGILKIDQTVPYKSIILNIK